MVCTQIVANINSVVCYNVLKNEGSQVSRRLRTMTSAREDEELQDKEGEDIIIYVKTTFVWIVD